jgi:outer membrane protein assembly factor BamB
VLRKSIAMNRFIKRPWIWFSILLVAILSVYHVIAVVVTFHNIEGPIPLEFQWIYDTGERVVAVAISPNGIVVAETNNFVLGIDAETGALLWKIRVTTDISPAPAIFDNSQVYFSNSSFTWAVVASMGELIWQRPTTYNSGTDARVVAVSSCCVFVSNISTALSALDRSSGEFLWDVSSGRGFADAFANNGNVYLVADLLYAIDEQTGSKLWNIGKEPVSESYFDPDTHIVYYRNGFKAISAFNIEKQYQIWNRSFQEAPMGELLKANQYLVDITNKGVTTLDASTGRVLWTTDNIGNNAAIVGDTVYLQNESRQSVVALDITSGEQVGSIQYGLPLLFVVNGLNDTIDSNNGTLVVGTGSRILLYTTP